VLVCSQLQRVEKELQRIPARLPDTTLEIADRPRAQPGALRQLLLGHPSSVTVALE
jgi:hypothetical protein